MTVADEDTHEKKENSQMAVLFFHETRKIGGWTPNPECFIRIPAQ